MCAGGRATDQLVTNEKTGEEEGYFRPSCARLERWRKYNIMIVSESEDSTVAFKQIHDHRVVNRM
jgi:hypothetical protein